MSLINEIMVGCLYDSKLCQPRSNKREEVNILAGPTPRSNDVISWRGEAINILKELKFDGIVYVPERENDDHSFDYVNQVWWEREALYNADVIVFWIPRSLPKMPAFTTNVEFGYWISKNSNKVVYGRPNDSEKNRYLDWLYEVETKNKPFETMKDSYKESIMMINNKKK